jgi:predicted permease
VFGNSNSLPISLVISLSKTLQGLHWDRIPGDNDNEVAARGILYLMIFQQLGQLVRWSWGYHVLLAPASHYEQDSEQGNSPYRDNPSLEHEEEDDDDDDDDGAADDLAERALLPPAQANGESRTSKAANLSPSPSTFESGGQTPVATDSSLSASASEFPPKKLADEPAPVLDVTSTPANGNMLQRPVDGSPNGLPMHSPSKDHTGERAGWRVRMRQKISQALSSVYGAITRMLRRLFAKLPKRVRQALTTASNAIGRFARGLWAFMNPPLWAMLAAIIVASIPNLQRLFFTPGTFVHNSVTSAISQSGGVAVPLILVVLGANLARNTLPTARSEPEDPALNRKLLIASLLGRMVLPTLIMAPLLALAAKYVPVSILDDPIFVVVCFLLTGAPSALQLAQICQINEVYEVVMSNLLFQSYVIWCVQYTSFTLCGWRPKLTQVRLGFCPRLCFWLCALSRW